MARELRLGVIGGSGLEGLPGLEVVEQHDVETPFGQPSDQITRARIPNVATETEILFLPRHGPGHRIPPSAINVRANIYALKILGVTHVLSISAVGSLRGSIEPGHLIAVNQIIDRTFRRVSTFFDVPGVVAHVGFADPVCPQLRTALIAATRAAAPHAQLHNQGTIVVIEGPRFSSRAESEQYRGINADVIGMNAMPEAALAREAELPYALLALSTDYDCWHRGEEAVTATMVSRVMKENVEKAQRIIPELARSLPDPTTSPAYRCLDCAIMSDIGSLNEEMRRRLTWLRPFAPP